MCIKIQYWLWLRHGILSFKILLQIVTAYKYNSRYCNNHIKIETYVHGTQDGFSSREENFIVDRHEIRS